MLIPKKDHQFDYFDKSTETLFVDDTSLTARCFNYQAH